MHAAITAESAPVVFVDVIVDVNVSCIENTTVSKLGKARAETR